jgi:hypothetical protein
MTSQFKAKIVECKYRGPQVISRDMLIGQTCWHAANLDASGRLHLFSKSCDEWGADCPARPRQAGKAN